MYTCACMHICHFHLYLFFFATKVASRHPHHEITVRNRDASLGSMTQQRKFIGMSSSFSVYKQHFLSQVQAVEIKILIDIRLNAITLPIGMDCTKIKALHNTPALD